MKRTLIISTAVRRCLHALSLDTSYGIINRNNRQQAKDYLKNHDVAAVITDLFMPVDDFQKFETRCEEIEFPHGLELISFLDDKATRTLVTTFFWNYPGFSRYVDFLDKHSCVNGALPKDVFYMVGTLDESTSIEDAQSFPPLRILLEAIWTLLKTSPKNKFEINLRQLRFRSLFDESSYWLGAHMDHLVEIRNDLVVEDTNVQERNAGTNRPKYDPDNVIEVTEYLVANPWMPSFVLRSPAGGHLSGRGSYKSLMKYVWDGSWSFDIEMNTAMAMQTYNIKAEHENIKLAYHSRFPEQLIVENFLTPRKPNGTGFAQLLLTLGYFSYWCHLPENRSALTPNEIARIIVERGGVPYKKEGNTKLTTVQNHVSEDLEYLDYNIRVAIANSQRKRWWKLLTRSFAPAIIASKRDKSNEFRYWLNGSVVLQRPRSLSR